MNLLTTSEFVTELGRHSFQAGVLVVLVSLVQWACGRRLSPRWRCAVWLIVAARLVTPFSVDSVTSLYNLWPLTIRLAAGLHLISERTLNDALPLEVVHSGVTPLSIRLQMHFGIGDISRGILPSWHLLGVACFWIWLVGVIILMGHIVISSLRLKLRCDQLRPLSNPAVLSVLEECYKSMGMSQRIKRTGLLRILETVEVSSPALHGFFSPSLLLPRGFTENFSSDEWRFVFLHELAHLKRHDLCMNWFMALLQAVHWFNPLVWLAFSRWRFERELACDAMVLEATGREQKCQYGHTILRLLEDYSPQRATPSLVGILESNHQLGRRIGMIKTYTPTNRWSVLSVTLILFLMAIGLTDAAIPVKPVIDLHIISASYGSGTSYSNVTERVEDLFSHPLIEFFAQPGWLGADPTPGWNKELVIQFVHNGKQHSFSTGEGGRVTVSDLLRDEQ